MTKQRRKLLARVALIAAAVLIAIGASYLSMRFSETEAPPAVNISAHERIQPQTLPNVSEEGPSSPPESPVVKTESGEDITLTMVMWLPSMVAIYRYNNDLYKYADGIFTYLPNSDAASFNVIQATFSWDLYAKDNNNVYCRGNVLVGANPSSFEEIPDWHEDPLKYFTSDKEYIYFQDGDRKYVYGDCVHIAR